MIATIQKWGNSLAVRIPAALADELGIGENESVELELRCGSLWLRPMTSRRGRSKRIPLATYLERITPENRQEPVDSGESVGEERIWD